MTTEKEYSPLKLKKKLTVLLYSLFFLLICGWFLLSGLYLNQVVLALSSNYAKSSGQQLTTTEWNNLPNDFLAKSGDTMSGDLNLGTHKITNLGNPTTGTDAVNQTSMTNAITAALSAGSGSPIKDSGGANLKMVCGSTVPGATAWQSYPGGTYVDIDISAAGFTAGSLPYIFTSLGGAANQAYTRGSNSIYTQGTTPLTAGFRVFIINDSGINNPWQTYQWYINWCAIGR